MRILALSTFGASALVAAALAGVGLFVGMNLDYTLARYPGATQAGEARVNLRSVPLGYFNQNDAYQTGDDVQSVWRWYTEHLNVEPAIGMPVQGQCMALAANQRLLIRRTVQVSLCSVSHRTLIFVNQAVSLGR